MKGFWASLSCIAFICLAGHGTAVRADSLAVDATLTGVAYNGVTVTLDLNDGKGHTYGATGTAGQYQWQQNSGTYVLGKAGSFSTFCIEITQDISLNTQYGYELTSLQNSPQPTPNYWIPNNGMGSADAAEIDRLWAADYSKVNSADSAAAFQFAIWKIIYGSQLTFSAGTPFNGSEISGDVGMASTWLAALPTSGSGANLVALSSSSASSPNPGAQDQITLAPPGYSAAPLPATAPAVAALLASLGALVGLRRLLARYRVAPPSL